MSDEGIYKQTVWFNLEDIVAIAERAQRTIRETRDARRTAIRRRERDWGNILDLAIQHDETDDEVLAALLDIADKARSARQIVGQSTRSGRHLMNMNR